jgi:hypothetical protein
VLSPAEIDIKPGDVDSSEETELTELSIWKPIVILSGFTKVLKEKVTDYL